jgi:hypothetical protein
MWLTVELLNDTTQVELTWGGARGTFVSYRIGRATLEATAYGVKQALNQLTLWDRSRDPDQLPRKLANLAQAGNDLRYALFNTPKATGFEKAMRAAYQKGDLDLVITSDPDLHIPWGLVFDGDVGGSTVSKPIVTKLDARFWCLKYNFSSSFSAHDDSPYSEYSMQRQRSDYRFVSAVSRDAYCGLEKDFSCWEAVPEGIAFNLATCEKKLNSACGKDTLFHFFGHMAEQKMHFDDEEINIVQFSMLLDRLAEDNSISRSLVFLNACDSFDGELDYSFRYAAMRNGVCGVIATEAKVPRKFAAHFGEGFLKLFYGDKKTVGETMHAIRHDESYWPLSLLYSSYAPFDYQLV